MMVAYFTKTSELRPNSASWWCPISNSESYSLIHTKLITGYDLKCYGVHYIYQQERMSHWASKQEKCEHHPIIIRYVIIHLFPIHDLGGRRSDQAAVQQKIVQIQTQGGYNTIYLCFTFSPASHFVVEKLKQLSAILEYRFFTKECWSLFGKEAAFSQCQLMMLACWSKFDHFLIQDCRTMRGKKIEEIHSCVSWVCPLLYLFRLFGKQRNWKKDYGQLQSQTPDSQSSAS